MNHRSIVLGLAVLIVFSANLAFGQSRFFEDHTTGVGINAAYSSVEDGKGFGGSFILTVNGRIDFGIGFMNTSFDEIEYGSDFSLTEFIPSISFAVVRPTDTAIIGFEIGGSYSTGSFSGDILDANNWDMSGKAVTLGGDIYLKLQSSPKLEIYPALGLYYAEGKTRIEDSLFNSLEENVSNALITARVSFLIDKLVNINPGFSSFDGNSTWSLSVGIVFPTSTK